jgi:predicted DNA-binding protein with PD1-like motif
MEYKKISDSWFIVLRRGEKIIESLKKFVQKENVISGNIDAIGAVSSIELGHYNPESKKFTRRSFTGAFGIVSLLGNVTMKGDERIVHCNIIIGNNDMNLFGGHLFEATVSGTCEIVFNEYKQPIRKELNAETGLNIITFK